MDKKTERIKRESEKMEKEKREEIRPRRRRGRYRVINIWNEGIDRLLQKEESLKYMPQACVVNNRDVYPCTDVMLSGNNLVIVQEYNTLKVRYYVNNPDNFYVISIKTIPTQEPIKNENIDIEKKEIEMEYSQNDDKKLYVELKENVDR